MLTQIMLETIEKKINTKYGVIVNKPLPMKEHSYYVYMLTNKHKTVLYTGVTNNLQSRLMQHMSGQVKGFTSKYNCYNLVHFECYDEVTDAIEREKQLKGLSRGKKDALIASSNPEWRFLNDEVLAW